MVSFHVLLIRVAVALPCEINLDVDTTTGSAKKRKNIKRILNKCYPVNRPLVERGTRQRPEPVSSECKIVRVICECVLSL